MTALHKASRSVWRLSPRKQTVAFATFSVATLFAGQSAQAVSATWNVNANGTFATASNWSPATVPGGSGTVGNTDTATFGNIITAARTVTVDANRNLQFITFDGAGFAYTLSSGSFLLTSGGAITLNSNVTAQQIVNSPITFQGTNTTYNFTSNGASPTLGLTVGGAVTGAASTASTLTLNGSSTAFVGGTNTGNAIGGIIANGVGGTLSLVKSDAGTWSLSGVNTFTGGTNVQAGTLITSNQSGLGAAANVVTLGTTGGASAATLGVNVSGGTIANPIVLAAGNTGALTIGTMGNNASATALSGGITGTNNLVFSNTSSTGAGLNVTGAVNVAGSITNSGTGTGGVTISGVVGTNVTGITQNSTSSSLTLTGANTFTGGVTVSAGSVLLNSASGAGTGAVSLATGTSLNITGGSPTVYGLNGAGTVSNTGASVRTLTLAGSGSYTFSGSIAPTTAANIAVTINNTGVQTLSGTNTYTGATTLAAGQLRLDFSAAGAPTSNIIAPTSTLALGVSNGGTASSNTLSLVAPNAATTTNYSQTFAGPGLQGVGMGHINLVVPTGSATTLTLNLGAFTGNPSFRATGTGLDFTIPTGATVTTTSNANLTAAGVFTNLTTVNQTDLATLVASGSVFNVVPYTAYTQATASSLGTSTQNVDFTNVASSSISASATVNSLRFNTATTHTLTQTGTNGQIIVPDGILVTPNVGSNDVTISGGYLVGTVGRDLAIAQFNTSGSLIVNSIIASSSTANIVLTKNGGGTMVVNATNVHNNTLVNEGTLVVGANAVDRTTQTLTTTNGSATITGVDTTNLFVGERVTGTNVTAAANGPRIFSITPSTGGMANGSITLESAVTTAGTVTAGSGTVTFNGGSGIGYNIGTGSGDVQIGKTFVTTSGMLSTPTLQIGNGGTTGSLMTGQTVTNNGLLTFNRSDTALNFGNVVSGTGNLAQNGAANSMVTISGANTYTGTTIVQSGMLAVGAANSVPVNSTVNLAGGTLTLGGNNFLTGARTGQLTLTATSTLDFGVLGTQQTINFANSSSQTWTGNLVIANYSTTDLDALNFGSATGLTPQQLAQINFVGFAPGAQIDGFGNVTPNAVPEPGTWAALLAGGVAFAGYRRWRRA